MLVEGSEGGSDHQGNDELVIQMMDQPSDLESANENFPTGYYVLILWCCSLCCYFLPMVLVSVRQASLGSSLVYAPEKRERRSLL